MFHIIVTLVLLAVRLHKVYYIEVQPFIFLRLSLSKKYDEAQTCSSLEAAVKGKTLDTEKRDIVLYVVYFSSFLASMEGRHEYCMLQYHNPNVSRGQMM